MPRLSIPQWLLFAAFLLFYGFAVFAVTRDYYLRQRPSPGAAGTAAALHPLSPRAPALAPSGAVPQAMMETSPDLLRQQADALFVQRRYAAAVPVYRRILELEPDDVSSQNDLGLALHYTGDTPGALQQLRAGAAQQPSHQRIWLTLGFVTLQAGDAGEARAALERARDLDPVNEVGKEAIRLLSLIDER